MLSERSHLCSGGILTRSATFAIINPQVIESIRKVIQTGALNGAIVFAASMASAGGHTGIPAKSATTGGGSRLPPVKKQKVEEDCEQESGMKLHPKVSEFATRDALLTQYFC